MGTSGIIVLVAALLGLILGWKPVTQMIGRTNFSLDQPAFNMLLSCMHLSLKIVLSVLLGYILFIINIIKFIIARINAKKMDANNIQNSSDGDN